MKFLEILGIITSILSFVLSLVALLKNREKVLAGIICIMTLAFAVVFYHYTLLADERIKEVQRREEAKKEASEIVATIPTPIYSFNPGRNKAIAHHALFYLEKYSDLFPISYEDYKEDILSKMDKAEKETSEYNKEELLKECAESARQLLMSMSH